MPPDLHKYCKEIQNRAYVDEKENSKAIKEILDLLKSGKFKLTPVTSESEHGQVE